MVCVNDIDKDIWKPIPFDQGIPDKLPKSRNKFKLPCHISLLKSKNQSVSLFKNLEFKLIVDYYKLLKLF